MDYMIFDIKKHFNIDMLKNAEYMSFSAFVILICVLVFIVSKNNLSYRIKLTGLILYLYVVYSMTVLMRIGSKVEREIRMESLSAIFLYKEERNEFLLWQGFLNILMFLPIGFLSTKLVIRSKGSIQKYLLVFICITMFSVIIEAEQFLLRAGCCDFNDILTNVVGGVIGIMIGSASDIRKKIQK